MNTTTGKISTKGLSAMLQNVLLSLATSSPNKAYSATEIHTEILRRNPGLSVHQAERMRGEVSKRLATMAGNSVIQRQTLQGRRYAYMPSTLDSARCRSSEVVRKAASLTANNTTNPLTKVEQVRSLISNMPIADIVEVISIATTTLTTQVESKESRLKDKIAQLIKTI